MATRIEEEACDVIDAVSPFRLFMLFDGVVPGNVRRDFGLSSEVVVKRGHKT